ncbi:beta transducin [Fusarium albosuccineum]|uniref:Beta transducin n=1 Tax=Fusarium albosuccineum TaxID=1237068 RepID=A0A8H4P669_9HYPO|nr:beta transducin [Fusarium albosuccineum]
MHLINVSTLLLEEFTNGTPEYAILSHTWGRASDEVNFQEMSRAAPSLKRKRGFRKIELCAKQAQDDGLQYCWVDTCCIDKSSSAELSEAINSMYAWYRRSAVCYVYLEDVDATDLVNDDYSSLKTARWFSRGWTLQELIAPRKRRFFGANWGCIGEIMTNRSSSRRNGFSRVKSAAGGSEHEREQSRRLTKCIRLITGIPAEVLDTGDLASFPVATKMLWAANRETTRVEDQAYSLLGIFDVNMPLLYGEGRKAFIRLQEEIIRKKIDHTLFVWSTMPGVSDPTFSGLLSPSPKHFRQGTRLRHEGLQIPYEMTNKGLHLQVPLVPIEDDPEEFYAILDTDNESRLGEVHCYSIRLRRVGGADQFARVNPSALVLQPKHRAELAQARHVYVKHFISDAPTVLACRYLSRIKLGCKPKQFLVDLLNVTSSGTWDNEAVTFHLRKNEEFCASIVIRCTYKWHYHAPFDVFVGWVIQKDDARGLRSGFTLLPNGDPFESDTLMCSPRLQPHALLGLEMYTEVSCTVVDGELEAEMWLGERPKAAAKTTPSPR